MKNPLPYSQSSLGAYLMLELQHRQDTLTSLSERTGLCPVFLKKLLHGQATLTPDAALRLALQWEISPGLLWHWQQDITHQECIQASAS